MTLDPRPPFPSSHAFVVKLHAECNPATGDWRGRLENMANGRQCEFSSADQLLRGLASMTPQSMGQASRPIQPTKEKP